MESAPSEGFHDALGLVAVRVALLESIAQPRVFRGRLGQAWRFFDSLALPVIEVREEVLPDDVGDVLGAVADRKLRSGPFGYWPGRDTGFGRFHGRTLPDGTRGVKRRLG